MSSDEYSSDEEQVRQSKVQSPFSAQEDMFPAFGGVSQQVAPTLNYSSAWASSAAPEEMPEVVVRRKPRRTAEQAPNPPASAPSSTSSTVPWGTADVTATRWSGAGPRGFQGLAHDDPYVVIPSGVPPRRAKAASGVKLPRVKSSSELDQQIAATSAPAPAPAPAPEKRSKQPKRSDEDGFTEVAMRVRPHQESKQQKTSTVKGIGAQTAFAALQEDEAEHKSSPSKPALSKKDSKKKQGSKKEKKQQPAQPAPVEKSNQVSEAKQKTGSNKSKKSSNKSGGGSKKKQKAQQEGSNLRLAFLASGVLLSFSLFGYAQEKVTRSSFGSNQEKFTFTSSLVLLQSLGNATVAAILLFLRYGSGADFTAGTSVGEWLKPSIAYLGAHKFGLAALKYIPFPMQVVCKSCKAIPVMFGEMLFDPEKKHPLSKKISVFVMCFGVAAFTLLGENKKSAGSTEYDTQTLMGLGLVMLALVCDGIYGPYQTKVKNDRAKEGVEVTADHLMLNMNMWQGIFSLIICIMEQEVGPTIAFCQRNPDVLLPILYFSGAMALGNLFIFKLQAEFGSLTTTLTTTIRKLISVILSVLLFGHSIQPMQWVAIAFVFLAKEISNKIAGLIEGTKQGKKD